MSQTNEAANSLPTVNITGDAVGVFDPNEINNETLKNWYIGITTTNKEKRCREVLEHNSYECFLPIQIEEHKWSQGRRRKIERLILRGYIFVHCTETERQNIFTDSHLLFELKPYLTRWMTDRSTRANDFGRHQIAKVPDDQMRQFIQVITKANEPVTIESLNLRKGSMIRVKSGELEGCIGELERLPDKSAKLVIRLSNLFAAKVAIDINNIEPFSDDVQ